MLRCEAPVHTARTLEDALRLRAELPEATLLAGGTDLMVYLEAGVLRPHVFVDLWGCDGLRHITEDGLRLGALATFTDVLKHPRTPLLLKEAAATVGAAQIQNRATLGGNICNASPAGDSLPVWLALDARFELASVRGVREVAAADFWRGYKRLDLAADELLTAIVVPPVRGETVFRKVGTRMAQSISKVVFAGRYVAGEEARLAFGAVAATPVRLPDVEAVLVAEGPSAALAERVAAAIHPIDDVRSTADYRRRVAVNVVRGWFGRL